MNISEFLIDIYKKQAKGSLTATEETLLDALDMGQSLYFTVKDTATSKTYYYAFPVDNFIHDITFGDIIGSDNFKACNTDCPVLIAYGGEIGIQNEHKQLQTQDHRPIQKTDYLLQEGNLVNTNLYLRAVE